MIDKIDLIGIAGLGIFIVGLFSLQSTPVGYWSNQSAFGLLVMLNVCILKRLDNIYKRLDSK